VVNRLLKLEDEATTINDSEEYAFARRVCNAIHEGWREAATFLVLKLLPMRVRCGIPPVF
jgi:hypothetical protein